MPDEDSKRKPEADGSNDAKLPVGSKTGKPSGAVKRKLNELLAKKLSPNLRHRP